MCTSRQGVYTCKDMNWMIKRVPYNTEKSRQQYNCYWRNAYLQRTSLHGPLARYIKLRVALAPGMPGTFSPPRRVSDPDIHASIGFPWSRWRAKRSRRMRNLKFYVSGKRHHADERVHTRWLHQFTNICGLIYHYHNSRQIASFVARLGILISIYCYRYHMAYDKCSRICIIKWSMNHFDDLVMI